LTPLPRQITVLYLAAGLLWILLSDIVLAWLISPESQPQQYAAAQSLKGWLFVLGTAVLLFLILRRQVRHIQQEMAAHRQTQQQLQALLQAIPLAVIQLDLEGLVRYWNPPAEEMFGWTAAEAMGEPLPYITAENEAEFIALRDQVLTGESFAEIEAVRQTKTGEPIHINISAAPVRNSRSEIVGIMAILKDITARKATEAALQQLNLELEQRVAERTAQLDTKNQELEAFAYSVSHDLKAPLRGIDGYGRLLQEDHAQLLNEEGQTFLRNIRRATAHMAELIDDLLTYSRLERQAVRRLPVNLATLVNGILTEHQETIVGCQAQIKQTGLEVTLPADPDALGIILRNLLDNALKFTKVDTTPVIEIGCRKREDEAYLLWVRDNGIGFDMQFHEKVFDIFQRLHRLEDYGGTGIGLALVRKAAARLNGSAWAESEPGAGATFYVLIPGNSQS
jgi:PAS domain S-box-containing protein